MGVWVYAALVAISTGGSGRKQGGPSFDYFGLRTRRQCKLFSGLLNAALFSCNYLRFKLFILG